MRLTSHSPLSVRLSSSSPDLARHLLDSCLIDRVCIEACQGVCQAQVRCSLGTVINCASYLEKIWGRNLGSSVIAGPSQAEHDETDDATVTSPGCDVADPFHHLRRLSAISVGCLS